MIPNSKDSHGYRKIGKPFLRSPTAPLPADDTEGAANAEKKDKKKLGKRGSLFHLGSGTTGGLEQLEDGSWSPWITEPPDSPQTKRGLLQKGRPSSVFGSIGRKSGNPLKERSSESTESTPESSIWEIGQGLEYITSSGGKKVLHHGEVQTTSGLFRKKKEYLVLTETHLMRYKSQFRASEVFSSIKPVMGRASTTRHPSTASIGSLQDLQSLTSHTSLEGENAIPLKQVVTAYKVEDGRPFFTTEVVYLDEETNSVGSVQLMLNDPKEADLWHTSIRAAAQKARLIASQPYPERVILYLVNVLETALDYDESHFQIFRVVRRVPSKSNGRASSDDLTKLGSSVSYMVIGINKIHLISLPDFGETPQRMLDAKASKSSFGLVTLTSMEVQHADDTFQLGFRKPLEAPCILDLAASASPEIATVIFRSIVYLKPQWLDYTFLFSGPRGLLDDGGSPIPSEEDNGYFDRTLVAYCAAYKCNATNIRYAIDTETEDAPEFRLMPSANGYDYSVSEILAVFRALRYNESFRSISFEGINLQRLHRLADTYGDDHVAWTSRSGLPIRRHFNITPADKSLLYQEVQALALKTKRVRRINFSNTLPRRRPRDDVEEGAVKDPGCEISAALLPLCRSQLSNIDWIIFSGIELGETDLEELVLALDDRHCHFRCLDVSRCALNDRALQIFLNHLEKQSATMECINISDNPGRIHLARFPITMSRFSQIRKLHLSRVTSTCGTEPLIAPEVMLAWRLEELIMNGVPVNDKTLDAVATYLASPMSDYLHSLQMDQCNMTGAHVAILMRSMCRSPGVARNLHIHVSANRLEKGNSEIVKAIEENRTPSHLTMRMVEYQTESRFKQLLEALRKNTTIRSLDISKASLPYDAGDETCEALQLLFEENKTLEELDISGEHAHLEIARFGIGLNQALTGLKKNKALKTLRIEYQNLGLEGAHTLSSVLEENDTLTHIYCDYNEITLQGFTVLVNALAKNATILSLPDMSDDQRLAVKRMTSGLAGAYVVGISKGEGGVKHSMRRTLNTFGVHLKDSPSSSPTPQDVDEAVNIMNARWKAQVQRLESFLYRNQSIAAGFESQDLYLNDETLRPSTAISEAGIIQHVLSNTTPKVERSDPVDMFGESRVARLTLNHENEKAHRVGYFDFETEPIANSQLTSRLKEAIPVLTPELGNISVMENDK